MKRISIYLLFFFNICFAYTVEGQVIKGKIIVKFMDDYEPLPGVTISIDSINKISDIDGLFLIDSLISFPDSITLEGSFNIKLKVINLPDSYDTLDLGTIELINNRIISSNQYDSIRNELINTFETDLIIMQQDKADKILSDKYKPIYDWNHIVGYLVKDDYEITKIRHPYNDMKEIELKYDGFFNSFILDFNNIN